MVPVHPEDKKILGMQWKDRLYIDICLPFGLRSAPRIFTGVADMLKWWAKQQGCQTWCTIWMTMLPGGDRVLRSAILTRPIWRKHVTSWVFQWLMKNARSSNHNHIRRDRDRFLNYIDLRLPEDKLRRIHGDLKKWIGKKAGQRRELCSIAAGAVATHGQSY